MKTTRFILSVLFIFVFALTSCIREDSSDVNQDKIHKTYELFYNGNEDKTYARATFKFSNITGTHLELTSPSQVTFNGDVLSFKSAVAYYEKEYAGLVSSGTFVWTDVDGVTYTNSISLNTIDFPASLDTIATHAAYEMIWVGDSLGSNEHVFLTIRDQATGTVSRSFSQDNIHSNSIILSLNKLQELEQGENIMIMDRHYRPALTEKTSAGGIILARYRPVNNTVLID